MMLTVIYFFLLQPLDDDDRSISRYLSTTKLEIKLDFLHR